MLAIGKSKSISCSGVGNRLISKAIHSLSSAILDRVIGSPGGNQETRCMLSRVHLDELSFIALQSVLNTSLHNFLILGNAFL